MARIKTIWLPKMNAKDFAALLRERRCCTTARAWAEGKTLATVWRTCKRGDWMDFLLWCTKGHDPWLSSETYWNLESAMALVCGGDYEASAAWLRKHVKVRP